MMNEFKTSKTKDQNNFLKYNSMLLVKQTHTKIDLNWLN